MADDRTPSPWGSAGDRAQQKELKRQAVLQTAARLFNERGFHATSLDDIARALHVTKPTLYYYVKSKDDILLECVRIALELMRDEIAQVRAGGGRALDQLVACMRSYAGIVTQEFGRCVIRVGEDPLPEPRRKELRRLKAGIDLEFRRLVQEAQAEGTLAPCDPKLAAFMLAGALSWIGRWYRADGEMHADAIARQAIGLLLRGVLAPGVADPQGGGPVGAAAAARRRSRTPAPAAAGAEAAPAKSTRSRKPAP